MTLTVNPPRDCSTRSGGGAGAEGVLLPLGCDGGGPPPRGGKAMPCGGGALPAGRRGDGLRAAENVGEARAPVVQAGGRLFVRAYQCIYITQHLEARMGNRMDYKSLCETAGGTIAE